MTRFVVLGPVVPKARARAGKVGHYTPQRTRAYEQNVRLLGASYRPRDWPLGGRYAVRMTAYMQDERRRDLDNIAKSVLDGLNGALWSDDSQIDVLHIVRSLDRELPRVEVMVEVLR